MILTNKQEEGLKIAIERYRNHEKLTVISGYAGVGKSQLVKFIIEALDVKQDEVCYATFTGKAAEVLRKKGNPGAITLHKLLYKFVPKPNGGYRRFPRTELEYKVVVVDEVGMVPIDMMKLLLGHRCHIICLGDPMQLPPIRTQDDNGLLYKPHIFLDEIMRQAKESEIVRLSMNIREGKPLKVDEYKKEVKIIPRDELNTGMLTWSDIILCSTNKTRQELNNKMREIAGFGSAPQEGDKVICTKNSWSTLNFEEDALVNGSVGIIQNVYESFYNAPLPTRGAIKGKNVKTLMCDFIPECGSPFNSLALDYKQLTTGKSSFTDRELYLLRRYKDALPLAFDWGYAITCHKAQGTSWDKVLIIEENFPFDKEDHRKWLYTAVTRATSRVVLVRP